MAKALLVIDLQEEYLGKNRNRERFGKFEDTKIEEFIMRVNKHVADYEAGIKEMEIAGIDATKCAYHTAKGAVNYGIKTSMLIDAIDTIYPQDVEKCEKDLKSRGVIFR